MKIGKVLIIDDSVFVQNYMSKLINSIPDLELVGVCANGLVGVKKTIELLPDIIILDLEMDQGDGLYVLQQIEQNIPFGQRPFVLIYSSRVRRGDPLFKKAIDFGFCDFVLKVEGTIENIIPHIKSVFIPKILSGIEAKNTRALLHSATNSFVRPTLSNSSFSSSSSSRFSTIGNLNQQNNIGDLNTLPKILYDKKIKPKLLLIGGSTGAPQVIRNILQKIDERISIPIVIVQHMPENFTKSFALELTESSNIPVYELKHNVALEKGKAYIMPGGTHGKLNSFGNLLVYYTDRNNYDAHPFKPSINLAIDSLQESIKSNMIGVILSGMGKDGALGMKTLRDKGSLVFAQDELSSAVWGMPGTAVRNNGVDVVLSHDELGTGIVKALTYFEVHPLIGGLDG